MPLIETPALFCSPAPWNLKQQKVSNNNCLKKFLFTYIIWILSKNVFDYLFVIILFLLSMFCFSFLLFLYHVVFIWNVWKRELWIYKLGDRPFTNPMQNRLSNAFIGSPEGDFSKRIKIEFYLQGKSNYQDQNLASGKSQLILNPHTFEDGGCRWQSLRYCDSTELKRLAFSYW